MSDRKITIFTSNTWGYCHEAMDWLKERNHEFTEKNINEDPEARQELIRNGFMGVPIFYIGDEVVQGFDKKRLENLLK